VINSQLLLFLNLGFGILLVLYFVLGRPKAKQPTKLNMRGKESGEKTMQVLEPENLKPARAEESRSLSVIFMYNGHDWEAHDVLGVPQGASMHEVTKVYQELVKKTDSRSLQFYEHAYNAISIRHRKHRL